MEDSFCLDLSSADAAYRDSQPELHAQLGKVHQTSLAKAFVAGSLSGTFSTLLFQPFDLVKTRLQVEGLTALSPAGRLKLGGSNGMLYTFYSVARREHVIGLWRGLVPSLSRCVPGIGMYFCALHGLSQFTSEERTMGESVLLGACARSLAGITLLPVTVVKTRFESGFYGYNSMLHALTSIWKSEGGKGLYSGLLATVARDAPFSGLYLMFYTKIKKQAKNELGTPELSSLETFICGGFAGVMASVVTQPADVVKTRVQLFPHKYSSTGSAVFSILKTNGVYGLFKGIVPRTMRRTLMAALSWTVYEQISRELGLTT
ncbi:hypothetical protein OS493_016319 [Desmophyllum pertusum]|uniref:Mitochondrial glycine transporter n=1 Tax=Desmophyllum pertusum TaxID=174260 RepID=A0A9W9ZPT3_9CNID|nr:hypothetical protein OS493_016319 [Desmophyllum pertusum]